MEVKPKSFKDLQMLQKEQERDYSNKKQKEKQNWKRDQKLSFLTLTKKYKI